MQGRGPGSAHTHRRTQQGRRAGGGRHRTDAQSVGIHIAELAAGAGGQCADRVGGGFQRGVAARLQAQGVGRHPATRLLNDVLAGRQGRHRPAAAGRHTVGEGQAAAGSVEGLQGRGPGSAHTHRRTQQRRRAGGGRHRTDAQSVGIHIAELAAGAGGQCADRVGGGFQRGVAARLQAQSVGRHPATRSLDDVLAGRQGRYRPAAAGRHAVGEGQAAARCVEGLQGRGPGSAHTHRRTQQGRRAGGGRHRTDAQSVGIHIAELAAGARGQRADRVADVLQRGVTPCLQAQGGRAEFGTRCRRLDDIASRKQRRHIARRNATVEAQVTGKRLQGDMAPGR